MKIQYYKILLKKRFPLKISRGVKGNSYNVFISVEKDGITGSQIEALAISNNP